MFKQVNTKSAVLFEAIKRDAVDRLCSIGIAIDVRFGHRFVVVYDPASKDSESTWYELDYSNFDIIRDVCSVVFDVVYIDAAAANIDGLDMYSVYGIESEEVQ